jgi:hypothetical protein
MHRSRPLAQLQAAVGSRSRGQRQQRLANGGNFSIQNRLPQLAPQATLNCCYQWVVTNNFAFRGQHKDTCNGCNQSIQRSPAVRCTYCSNSFHTGCLNNKLLNQTKFVCRDCLREAKENVQNDRRSQFRTPRRCSDGMQVEQSRQRRRVGTPQSAQVVQNEIDSGNKSKEVAASAAGRAARQSLIASNQAVTICTTASSDIRVAKVYLSAFASLRALQYRYRDLHTAHSDMLVGRRHS